MPIAVQDVLSVDLILLNLTPYLSISDFLRLAATSKDIRSIIFETQGCLRHLDLSTCKGGSMDIAPIDRGGEIWRAERMDESVTEDEFYGGPTRGMLSYFRRRKVLRDVQTLVLDRQSVPADILHEIICGGEYRVRLLSLLEAKNLNQNKFQQTLAYACRLSRPEGSPLLRGVYLFSDVQPPQALLMQDNMTALYEHDRQIQEAVNAAAAGITASIGAQLGAQINSRSRAELYGREPHPAYRAVGGKQNFHRALSWEKTLDVCRDIIAFDAVLCRGPRHDPSTGTAGPAIASVFLSSHGCEECGTIPEGPAAAGRSPISHLPLLRPIPLYAPVEFIPSSFPDPYLSQPPHPSSSHYI